MTGQFFSRMVLVQNKRNEAQANADCDDNYNPLHHGFPQAPLLLLTLTGKGAQDFNQRMQIIEQGGAVQIKFKSWALRMACVRLRTFNLP